MLSLAHPKASPADNAEANLYGAASSNHPEVMRSFFPTLLAAMPLGKARACLPSWQRGGHESAGAHGQQTEAMGCGCANYNRCAWDVDNRSCPQGFGGFAGIELPLQLGDPINCDSCMPRV